MTTGLSRREFLAGLSAASAAWFGGAPFLVAEDNDAWGGFPIGVQTISLRKYALAEVLRHLQGMGVRYVELSAGSHLPASSSDEQVREARTLAAMAGLTITAQGVNRFSKDHAANKRVFEF